jgi:hypothetical protein
MNQIQSFSCTCPSSSLSWKWEIGGISLSLSGPLSCTVLRRLAIRGMAIAAVALAGLWRKMTVLARPHANYIRKNQRRGRQVPAERSSSWPKRRGRMPRNWQKRRVDTEFDMVIVPADGISMSGSDSEDSDWSVGWFEPHHADFAAENDQLENNSFAVLVPCYGSPSRCQLEREEPNPAWTAILANLSRQTSQEAKEHLERWLACLWDSQYCWFKGPCAVKQLKVWHCTIASPKVAKYLASICLLSLYIILSDFLVYSSWIFKKTQWNIEAIWGWRRKRIKRNYSNIKFAIVKAVAIYYHLLHLQQVTEDCLFLLAESETPLRDLMLCTYLLHGIVD